VGQHPIARSAAQQQLGEGEGEGGGVNVDVRCARGEGAGGRGRGGGASTLPICTYTHPTPTTAQPRANDSAWGSRGRRASQHSVTAFTEPGICTTRHCDASPVPAQAESALSRRRAA
jgi:hypothetical protein